MSEQRYRVRDTNYMAGTTRVIGGIWGEDLTLAEAHHLKESTVGAGKSRTAFIELMELDPTVIDPTHTPKQVGYVIHAPASVVVEGCAFTSIDPEIANDPGVIAMNAAATQAAAGHARAAQERADRIAAGAAQPEAEAEEDPDAEVDFDLGELGADHGLDLSDFDIPDPEAG